LVVVTLIAVALFWSDTVVYPHEGVIVRVDQAGREVHLPAHPKRVIAFAPSITEIIYQLKKEKLLKGVTRFSDYPEAALSLPRIGSYINLDLEKIMSLQPDLCIAIKDGNPKITISRLEGMRMPVYAVNPKDMDSVINSVVEIGEILGARERAALVVDDMNHRIEKVTRAVKNVRYRPNVFFQIGIAPIVSVGSDTFIHELIHIAGGRNLADKYTSYPRFSKEDVLSLLPDIIIVTSMEREKAFEQVKKEWRQWPGIPAVKNDRIFLVDSNVLDRPTPRLVDGLELLVQMIHPELFSKRDRGETTKQQKCAVGPKSQLKPEDQAETGDHACR